MLPMISFLYCLSAILLAIMFILLSWFLRNCVLRFRKDPETHEPLRSQKRIKDSFLFLLTLVFLFAGLAVCNFSLFMQTFRIFTVGEPAARLEIISNPQDKTFQVKIENLKNPLAPAADTIKMAYTLTGDKWILEGNVIRFHDYLNYLGFKPVYQLTRLQSSYFSVEEEKKNPRSLYSFVDSGSEEWWRWMYRNGGALPFVKISFGSAVSQSADTKNYIVKVLPTGFTLEESPVENPAGTKPGVAQ